MNTVRLTCRVMLRNLILAAAWVAVTAGAVPGARGHDGVPVDPSITEDTPREHSLLYLERKDQPWTPLDEGVGFQEVRAGTGASPRKDAIVFVMWRMFDMKDGREIFYRTKHRTDSFFYGAGNGEALGGGGVLRAVELALKDMREGGKRMLTVTSAKAFGREGWSDSHFVVPPETDLVIELSLLWVRDPNPKRFSNGQPFPRPYAALAGGKETRLEETTGPLSGSSPQQK